jgi:anti-sigma regulatory factor (Ser/Thr protein kinase)
MTTVAPATTGSFDHDAFVYADDDRYVATLVPQVHAAVERGDAVYVVVPEPRAALLGRELGAAAAAAEFFAAETWYEHPPATIAGYDRVLRSLPAGRRAFVIGEVQFGDSPAQWSAWTRYEAALNAVLDRYDARVICPYDVRALPDYVVAAASATHPHLVEATARTPSGVYTQPEIVFTKFPPSVPLPVGTPDVDLRVQARQALREARQVFRSRIDAAGLGDGRSEELTLAVNEIVTNAVIHGGGSARVRVWLEPERRSQTQHDLVVAVDDDGTGCTNPLLGLRPPPPLAGNGYGVWLARQVFTEVDLQRSPTGGLRVVMAAAGSSKGAFSA